MFLETGLSIKLVYITVSTLTIYNTVFYIYTIYTQLGYRVFATETLLQFPGTISRPKAPKGPVI